MDTITGALHGKNASGAECIVHPQTQIKQVVGLQTELAKAITGLTASGGTITITKANGATSTITIATTTSGGGGTTYNIATASSDGLMSAEMFSKLQGIETGAQKNSTALATTTSNGLMSKEDKTLLNNLSCTSVTGVKGSSENEYRTGDVSITPANIGLGNVNNTADNEKSVNYATTAGSATKSYNDESGNNIKASYASNIEISDYTITLKSKNNNDLKSIELPNLFDTGLTYSLTRTNLDEITQPRFYTLNGTTNINIPSGESYGLLLVVRMNGPIVQIFIPIKFPSDSATTFVIYYRMRSNTADANGTFNWSIWRHHYYGG